MLNLRIVRGPLRPEEDEAILREYNRLTQSHVRIGEFRRWVQRSPEGPAWHCILETDERRIVGHASVIPLGAQRHGSKTSAGKGEYLFVHEDSRRQRVRGFEKLFASSAFLLLDTLYRHCAKQGLEPLIISAPRETHALMRLIGCRPIDFPLREGILILDPWRAARLTPNLTPPQRAAFFLSGISQRALWSVACLAFAGRNGAHPVPLRPVKTLRDARLTFFDDEPSFAWRYPQEEYSQLAIDSRPGDHLVAKHSSDRGYLRVCQWRLADEHSVTSALLALIRTCREENRLGVRWAVYENTQRSAECLSAMRKLGFLCARRTRTIFLYTGDADLLVAQAWNITDSLFTFDY